MSIRSRIYSAKIANHGFAHYVIYNNETRPLNLAQQHGHFLNSTGDVSLVTCDSEQPGGHEHSSICQGTPG